MKQKRVGYCKPELMDRFCPKGLDLGPSNWFMDHVSVCVYGSCLCLYFFSSGWLGSDLNWFYLENKIYWPSPTKVHCLNTNIDQGKYIDISLFNSRHVVLPPEVAKLLPKNRLLSEVNKPWIEYKFNFPFWLCRIWKCTGILVMTRSNHVSRFIFYNVIYL